MTGLATGQTTAAAHGDATWKPTSRYIAERTESLHRASDHLRTLAPHCRPKQFLLLERLLQETAVALQQTLPPELPFLVSTSGMPQRLRIAAVMREWLLTSPRPRRAEHLKHFLQGYQVVTPLCLPEIRLMPVALRLAVTEKCELLPSSGNITHLHLLPRLLQSLTGTCRFIDCTDWKSLSEAVSQVHFLLQRNSLQPCEPITFPHGTLTVQMPNHPYEIPVPRENNGDSR